MRSERLAARRVTTVYARAIALCVAVAAGFAALPADAIIGGQLDGNGHPYVAAIGQPDGQGIYFTGTAISPTVVLTAAHAVRRLEKLGFTTARLTFDPVVGAASTWYTGTIHEDPAYDPSSTTNSNDLAVIVLGAPVSGVTPASLPTAGLVDQLATEGPRASFDMVGFGISTYSTSPGNTGDFSTTGTRHVAAESLGSVTAAWLRPRLDGGANACIGDSGAPSLVAGSDVVVGIFILEDSGGGGQCVSQPWDMRVDTPSARDFLGQYVSLP